MKRIAMGAVTGLAVWFASAVAAEAQQITPTGPLSIYSNQSYVTYTATITTNYSFWFYLTITNNSGTTLYTNYWYCTNTGPSFSFMSPTLDTSSWGLAANQVIDFHVVVQLSPTHRTTSDYNVTVQPPPPPPPPPPTSMAPRSESRTMMAAAVPNRKEEVGAILDLEKWGHA